MPFYHHCSKWHIKNKIFKVEYAYGLYSYCTFVSLMPSSAKLLLIYKISIVHGVVYLDSVIKCKI